MKFSVKDIDRLRYRPVRSAEEFLAELRSTLGLNDKATGARLALGRSLLEPVTPDEIEQISKIADKGAPIEGIHLFGDDSDIWGCLITNSAIGLLDESQAFRNLVEFHWSRGASLLRDDFVAVNRNSVEFIVQLAGRVARSEGIGTIRTGTGAVRPTQIVSELVKIKIIDDNDAWEMNSSGGNGLMVISGRPGSGKSQLALDMLAQAAGHGVRFLFLDLKGELEESPRQHKPIKETRRISL